MSLVMPRVLIVGGGGREHALAWKLAADPGVDAVIVAPGMTRSGTTACPLRAGRRLRWIRRPVVAVARREARELVVIGPEAPLAAGVADALIEAGFAVFGPARRGCPDRVEQGVLPRGRGGRRRPDGRAGAFHDAGAAIAFAEGLAASGRGVVVKADGLAAGKGVTVCDTLDEADRAIERLAAGAASARRAARVVIEERLVGREASVIALCDGRRAVRPAGGPRSQAAARWRPRARTPAAWAPQPARRTPSDEAAVETCSARSIGRSWPSWPGGARRSVAPCSRA